MREPVTVKTISEYNDFIFRTFKQWEAEAGNGHPPHVWFRGQDRDEPLLPRVLREVRDPNTGKKCNYNENYIHQAFSSFYRNYTSERFEDRSSEYYSFMQHYGIPTRLLDWTESGLLALYFAVNDDKYGENVQRVVWIMNPGALNRLTTEKELSWAPLISNIALVRLRMKIPGNIIQDGKEKGQLQQRFINNERVHLSSPDHPIIENSYFIEKLYFPLAFWPSSSGNIRITAQKGCFTIQGTDPQSIESVFDNIDIQHYLIKVKIQEESVPILRKQLQLMGISPISVYPDIFGLSTELSGPRYMDAEISEY